MTTTVVTDPIHGAIRLEPQEWEAVRSARFQRLRRIHQLALVQLVYPGATHTRFEHSLGVRAVAARLCEHLEIDGDRRAAILTAALLHDIGHGPFSHSSEQVVDELAGRNGTHELISTYMIRHDPHFVSALGSTACDQAATLLEHSQPRSVDRDIVSGPADADKLDYLLRDAYYCGVAYGRFDLERIIDSALTIDAPIDPRTFLGFKMDGIWAVEALLLGRHHMHRAVYGHKTAVAADIMLTRAILAGLEEDVLNRDAYQLPRGTDDRPCVTDDFINRYEAQTDEAVLAALADGGGEISADLGRRLLGRQIIKLSVDIDLRAEAARLGAQRIEHIASRGRKDWAETESEIAAALETNPWLVAIQISSLANATYRMPGAAIQPKDILLRGKHGAERRLHEVSEIFQDQIGTEQLYAYLYTPELTADQRDIAREIMWTALSAN